MSARWVIPLLCSLAATHALAQDGGVKVMQDTGDFPATAPTVALAWSGPEAAPHSGARVSRIHREASMTVWREARGAAEEVWGTVECWLGSLTQSKALLDQGNEHLTRGALWRSGPATREVARRRAIVLKRIAAIKLMRAREARS